MGYNTVKMRKKNVVQDVIPARKSIRNVVLPSKSKKLEEDSVFDVRVKIKVPEQKPTPSYAFEYEEPKKPTKKVLYISLAILVLALAFGISTLFKSAKVTLSPKQETRVLSVDFKAQKDISTAGLGFQIVSTTKNLDKTVVSSGQEKVSIKARGTIVVYNNTAQSQKLVATTRFQTPEGLVFRALSALNVPAKQVVNGKSVAGSVEVLVEADKAGIEYNVGLKDFTIPGFKGDSKYTQVYARSKTEMKDGFVGSKSVVTKEVLEATSKELENTLRDSLLKDIISQIPENFVLYTSGASYQFEPINEVSSALGEVSSGSTVLRKKGVINAIIFDRASLSTAIVAKVLPEASSDVVIVDNLENLDFSLKSPAISDLTTPNSITFVLKGDANLVWMFDESKLENDILGLSKNSAQSVIATNPAVEEAWIEIYPFWNKTIPNDPEKVTLVNTLAK